MNYYAIDTYDSAGLGKQLQTLISNNSAGNWFALIDTAFTYGSAVKWADDSIWPVYFKGKFEELEHASPCLMPLSVGNAQYLSTELTQLFRRCHGRPMLGFINTRRTADAIRLSWQGVLEVETSDCQDFLLRFADTRVTPVIAKVLAESAWARLTDGIDQWVIIDREGVLQSLPLRAQQAPKPADRDPIRLDDNQLNRILDHGAPDALADVLHEHFPDLLSACSGASVYRRLAAVCDLAATCCMESSSDLMILAVAFFLSDGRLLNDANFVMWLKKRPWEVGDFADAMNQYVE